MLEQSAGHHAGPGWMLSWATATNRIGPSRVLHSEYCTASTAPIEPAVPSRLVVWHADDMGRVGVLFAAAFLIAGCSSDAGEPNPQIAEGVPPLPGPGTELLDGFVVPEGSQLLGPVFPFPQGTYAGQLPESAWSASLVVDGDPRVVVDDFLDQAVTAGLEVKSNCEVGPRRATCSAHARRVVAGFDEEQVFFQVGRSASALGGTIDYQRWPPGLVPEGRGRWDDAQGCPVELADAAVAPIPRGACRPARGRGSPGRRPI